MFQCERLNPLLPSWLRLQEIDPFFPKGTSQSHFRCHFAGNCEILPKERRGVQCFWQRCTQRKRLNKAMTNLCQAMSTRLILFNDHIRAISSYLFQGQNGPKIDAKLTCQTLYRWESSTGMWIKYKELPSKAPSPNVLSHSEHRPLSY